MRNNPRTDLDNLKKLASDPGANDAKVITPDMVTIKDGVLNLCQKTLCPNVGAASSRDETLFAIHFIAAGSRSREKAVVTVAQ